MTDNPFIISPRITFEVSVRLLGGLMALGYTIAAILKRSSRVFSDGKATVKIDWLEQLNRQYIQVSIIFVVRLLVVSCSVVVHISSSQVLFYLLLFVPQQLFNNIASLYRCKEEIGFTLNL